jgi:fructokinase
MPKNNTKYRVGFDLGGTKLKVIVLDSDNNKVYKYTAATRLFPADIYADIETIYRYVLDNIVYGEHTVGIGIPGNVIRPSYLLDGTDVNAELGKIFKVPFRVENDANCFTLAEATVGAGAGAGSVFGVILGTGVGGGFAINGQLYSGHSGMACEWGHTPLIANGHACWCGNSGCVERYISGNAVEKIYLEASGQALTAKQVFAHNELISLCVRQDFYANLAQGLATVINFYDPEVVVIGGGLSNIKEIYHIIPEKVEALIFNSALRARIVPAALGDDAGAVGAALL